MDTTTTKTGRRRIVPAATPSMKAPSTEEPVVERVEEDPAATASSLASALAEIKPPVELDDEDEALPDNNLREMLAEQEPAQPQEITPRIQAYDPRPTHATVARELSAFKRMIGDSTHIEISRENDIGQQVIIGQYQPKDVEPYSTINNFILSFLAPRKGGGTYYAVGTSANGKRFLLETVRVDATAIEDPKERGMNDMNRDLLQRQDSLVEKLLEVRSQRPPEQPNVIDMMRQLDELKKSSGDNSGLAMMMLMQSQNRGPDPSVAALTDIVKDLAREMKDLRNTAMAPLPPMGPPPVDPMVLALQIAEAMRPPPAPPPPDTLGMVMQIAALLKPPPAADPLETLVKLRALSKDTDNTPFKERMEEMFMLKKMMGGDNPFGDILKTFMTSQLGAGLGNGLGDAIRKKAVAETAPQTQAPALPQQAAPPNFPEGYLTMFQKQISEAADDAALVEAVVGSLLMLGGDANWKRFAGAFMQAAVADDLVKVNEMLQVLFNVWAEKGATIPREKLDLAIKAVNVSWNVIVQKLCEVLKAPLPESYTKRMAAASAPPAPPEPPRPESPRPAVSLVPPLAPETAPVAS